ncbi:MAG TPA: tetratricopeptide repeat protein [Anaerolineales bacterium]
MHRLVPDLIVENYRAGNMRGSFKAASLFLDISGFSSMTDALMGQGRGGAEILAITMRAVFDPLVEAIFAHAGFIVGYAGDSISALFPAEADPSSAARRALAAAHTARSALEKKHRFETPFGTFNVAAKIGLGMGSVEWGIIASQQGDRAVYYFRGDAVDAASRAEHEAGRAEVLLTQPLHEHLGATIDSKPIFDLHSLGRVNGQLPAPEPISLPPVDPSASSPFVGSALITQDLQGEFRQTVHLFMRVPDLPDEQLQRFMTGFFDVQTRYGGMIDRIDFGDKGCSLNVAWGAPIARENDIDRALNFMLDLRTISGFPVTAGITYYGSYAGYIGGRLYETYTTYGWGISLAARFMTDAPDGEIWTDERITQRVKERFEFDFIGERGFKGFAQKQKVYRLYGRKSGTDLLFRGRMVGRDAELQALVDFVQPLWIGKYAGVLGIWGEGGMGKTRLVHEFMRSPDMQQRHCLWAICQTDEILRRSLNPFRYWLLQYFEILPGQDGSIRLRKFMTKLDDLIAATSTAPLAAELKHARPFLARLVDLEWPDSLYEQLDAQGRYDNTILALISLVKAESLRQPLILFVEDAQYLDEDSKALIPRLKRALSSDPVAYPVAILMTTRWEGTRVLLEDGLVDRDVDLSALRDESVADMAREVLGQVATTQLVSVVNERAQGNPFYTEQILHYLQEQELLQQDSTGTLQLKVAAQATALPVDISAMLVSRLDKLPGPVKDVVQAASVLGRVFDISVLRRMLDRADSLQNEIAVAEQAAVWSPLNETRFIFNHDLLRDVAYQMQLESRRKELHARAFEALRELTEGDRHRHNGALAYHSEQAGLLSEARRYLSLAGDAARDGYHNAQALDFYRRALALQPGTDLKDLYCLHRECEKILAELGRIEERGREIDALQVLADSSGEAGDQAEVALLRSRLSYSTGRYEESAESARRAKDLALGAGRFDIAIGAYWSLLDGFYARGMYKDAIEHGEAGINLSRKQAALLDEASIMNTLGLVVLEMKNPSAARAYFEQSLSIFRNQDNVRGVSKVLANLGTVAGYQGHYGTALAYYEQSLRLTHEIGSRSGECARLGNMGWLSGLLGDYRKAQSYVEQSLQIAREIGDRRTEIYSLINLSSHEGAVGDLGSAIQHAEQGLALARSYDDRSAQAWALTYLGHGLLESGLLEPARAAYEEALKIRRELDQATLATEPAAGLARIALSGDDPASAEQHVNSILTQLDQDGSLEGTDQPLRVYLSCYLVLLGIGHPRCTGILNIAHDMLKTRANGISDPLVRQVFLEEISYNREIMALWRQRHGDQRVT